MSKILKVTLTSLPEVFSKQNQYDGKTGVRQDGITNSLLGKSGYKVDRDSASLFLLSLVLLFKNVRSLIYCQNKNSLKQCFPTH